MTNNDKLGALKVAYNISTSTTELEKFKEDCRNYLKEHGLSPSDPGFSLFGNVARGHRMTWPDCLTLVNLILEETESVGRGPSDALFNNNPKGVSMPLLTSFYQKYVENKDLEWVERKCVASEMRAELCGASPSW